ncbi:hypothetical protein [Porticoccus sp.]
MTGSNDFEPIKPADLPLTSNTPPVSEPLPWQQRRSTWAVLVACILLALVVIFVLPSLVKPPELPPVLIDTGTQNAAALAESPFRDAQLASARRAAQDVLAKILEKKAFLERNNVLLWGDEAFQQALKKATEGDASYRKREFDNAQTRYQQALDLLQGLETAMPGILSEAISAGNGALESGDAATAREQFQRVLAMAPDNGAAQAGIARAAVLDQVTPLLDQANLAVQDNQLDEARTLFKQALALDSAHPAARSGLQQVEMRLKDKAFNDAMSRGFSALENNQLNSAKTAFNDALQLQPDSQAARTGLAQAASTATRQTIQSLLQRAAGQETHEQWHQARDNYALALATDGSVMEARLGQLRSSARADLDDRIARVLDDPLRLASTEVLKQARQVLADARGIKAPGPKLREQIVRLEQVLNTAVTPLTVEMLSDNDTRVTLYKIGELGQFNRKQLSLVPGNYVAVGSRPGYRDVRVEFQVTTSNREKPVIVVCTEPVS